MELDKKDLLMPLFVQLVGNFDDVKKLYADDKPIEAYDLFKQKYKEIESSTRKPSQGVKFGKVIGA